MFKKIISLCLIVTMFLGSMIGISARDSEITTYPTPSQNATDNIISDRYVTHYPDQILFDGVSVSVSERSYSAHREANGDVILTINETMNTTACYYRLNATDHNGIYFTPEKDFKFYIESAGVHTVRLPASSISWDGYVYLYFALNPNKDPNLMFYGYHFRIPVDYEKHKVVSEDYLKIQPNQDYRITGMNGQYMDFNATATLRSDGSLVYHINIKDTNAIPTFEHHATSRDGDVFLPNKNNIYSSVKPFDFDLAKYNVSYTGDVYFAIWFNTSNGSKYKVDQLNIPVQ